MVKDGVVINLIEWDGNTETWPPPEGVVMVLTEPDAYIDIGWLWDGTSFGPP